MFCSDRQRFLCVQMTIGKQLKQFCDLPDSAKLGFSVFVSGLARVLWWALAVLLTYSAFAV
jgi:hypothetical protein